MDTHYWTNGDREYPGSDKNGSAWELIAEGIIECNADVGPEEAGKWLQKVGWKWKKYVAGRF